MAIALYLLTDRILRETTRLLGYTHPIMIRPDLRTFRKHAKHGNLIPLYRRIFSDQLTPVLAYRRLVAPDDRTAPSFLLESVEGGSRQGRYSFLGAHPAVEITADECKVTVIDHRRGSEEHTTVDDPLAVPRAMSNAWRPVLVAENGKPASGLSAFTGGWVGYAGYDTVRYAEPSKLGFTHAPNDDRALPDMHLGLYDQCVVFDHASKVLYAVQWIFTEDYQNIDDAYDAGCRCLDLLVDDLQKPSVALPAGSIDLTLRGRSDVVLRSNMNEEEFVKSVKQAKEYILAGDIFQVVLSQRFERETSADPFEIYRALRIVNPSPYEIYLQARGSILVASSPEILCRVHDGVVTNRPLAGTRKRGTSPAEDEALAHELLADEKERAEHIMLVDLGRNDVGKVCEKASVTIERMMEIEKYSHVMHISSTVTGKLRSELDAWDAMRAALPVGTVSGAPKVRAMQIIDELEPTRRGPYGGGIGVVGFSGDMDMALALRTMVIEEKGERDENTIDEKSVWKVHLQAGAGIVADSQPLKEYEETINKAAGLARAIDLAEQAFDTES